MNTQTIFKFPCLTWPSPLDCSAVTRHTRFILSPESFFSRFFRISKIFRKFKKSHRNDTSILQICEKYIDWILVYTSSSSSHIHIQIHIHFQSIFFFSNSNPNSPVPIHNIQIVLLNHHISLSLPHLSKTQNPRNGVSYLDKRLITPIGVPPGLTDAPLYALPLVLSELVTYPGSDNVKIQYVCSREKTEWKVLANLECRVAVIQILQEK